MGLFDENGLDSYFGDYAGLANPYQDDSGSMGLQDPFPMQDFRTNQISSMLNPQQSAADSIPDVMSQIGSGVQRDPVLQRYFDLAAQGPPQREDYEPSLGRKILAAVGGLGYVFSDPKNAAKNTDAILDHPYDEAAGQYNENLKVAADAAKSEGGLLNTGASIFRDVAQEKNYQSLAGRRTYQSDQGQQKIDNAAANNDRIAAIKQQMADDTAAYHRGELSIQEVNSRIAAGRLALSQAQSDSLINERTSSTALNDARRGVIDSGGPITGSRSTGPTVNRPSAAVMNRQVESAIKSDPILGDAQYFLPDGSMNIQRIYSNPDAKIAYQRIMRNYGMVQQPQPFQMDQLFNSQNFEEQ